MTAVFVTHATALSNRQGGQQICTREYVETIRAAGIGVSTEVIAHDDRLSTRVRQKIAWSPFAAQWKPEALDAIGAAVDRVKARFVCLNLVNLATLAAPLRSRLPRDTQIVLLSHGLESADFLHTIPSASSDGRLHRQLGALLVEERRQREHIDHVFCLTPFEAEIERWLGAPRVTPLPRTIPNRLPIEWKPDPSRLGFVGTLDHPPTREGLDQFLAEFARVAPAELRVRVVGAPEAAGRALAARFPSVDYLGPLGDTELEREAATWSACLHPLFCYARGCSTKLAIFLSWQLPIVTTSAGARGYTWREGRLPMGDTPAAFARLACEIAGGPCASAARGEVAAIVRSAPTIEEVGAMIKAALA
jgi:hypothetical protein